MDEGNERNGFFATKKIMARIEHIGIVFALCSEKRKGNLREDLGYERYLGLGVEERFSNEKPYRICKQCLKRVKELEEYFDKK